LFSETPQNTYSFTIKKIIIFWKNLKPPPLGKISNYKNKCIQQVHGIEVPKLLQAVMKYHQPAGKKNPEAPIKETSGL
jgi:hypothetical protein